MPNFRRAERREQISRLRYTIRNNPETGRWEILWKDTVKPVDFPRAAAARIEKRMRLDDVQVLVLQDRHLCRGRGVNVVDDMLTIRASRQEEP